MTPLKYYIDFHSKFFSPILGKLPLLKEFDLDSSVSVDDVAKSILVGAFDKDLFRKKLGNEDM